MNKEIPSAGHVFADADKPLLHSQMKHILTKRVQNN